MRSSGLLLRVLTTGAALASTAAAQDPLPLYPENYKVLVENERVRVLDFKLSLELHKRTPHLKASFERRKNQGWMTEITLWKRVEE